MKARHAKARIWLSLLTLVIVAGASVLWWPRPTPVPAPATPATNPADADGGSDDLPVPPIPPRIAEDPRYDRCMTMLAEDPEGAEAIATSWQAGGGGDAATHCQAMAKIANGEPDSGAVMLETLAHAGKLDGIMRAVVLGQASEARLMADQPEPALKDSNEALAIAPDDPDLLLGRANAHDALEHEDAAMDDLDHLLALDDTRGDALILRSAVARRLERLEQARSDIEKALTLDPDDAEALLERGILRERLGDLAGARQDWTRVREVDPNSEVAEVATQNLTLLDSTPDAK